MNEVISTHIVLLAERMWVLWIAMTLFTLSTATAVTFGIGVTRQARWTRNKTMTLSVIAAALAIWTTTATVLLADTMSKTITLTDAERATITADQSSIGNYLPNKSTYTTGQHITVARNGRDVCSMTITDASPVTRYLAAELTCVIGR